MLSCRREVRAAFAIAALLSVGAMPVRADSVESFYANRQITVLIPAGTGGSYAIYGQLAAKHMRRHIPGNPTMIVQFMPGAGGIKANNYFANVAARDGTALMSLHADSLQTQLLRSADVKYDASRFTAIGQFTDLNSAIAIWHKAPATTLDGVMRTEVILAATGKGSYQYQLPVLMNELLGTKFKVIPGYDSVAKQDLAMERGEIHGRTGSISSWQASRPEWLDTRKLLFVAQVGIKRSPQFGDVPLVTEIARNDDDRGMLRLITSGAILGRAVVATPEVPSDRVAALRAAFDRAVNDPELLEEARKQALALNPATGQELQRHMTDIRNVSPAIVAQVKAKLKLE